MVHTVSVAAPFRGARGASLFPGAAGRDLRNGSAVLTRLAASAGQGGVPHLSIFGEADTAVSGGTEFAAGDRLVIPGAGHNRLLFHEAVASRILLLAHPPGGGEARAARSAPW